MKKKTGSFPQTLHAAIKYFSDENRAFEFLKHMRWPDGIVKCPTCGSTDVSFISTRKLWKCKKVHPKQQFSVKVGTVLEDSPIALDKWLCAFWLITNCKNGISSYELHRSIGVTQKTAWFMLQRIRLAMQDDGIEKMKGRVEVDETYVGARARFMHKEKRPKGTGMIGKTAVMGLLQRNAPGDKTYSRVRLKVLGTLKRHEIDPLVRRNVEKGTEVFTDKFHSYNNLADEYVHNVIDHAECYAIGHVHTNGLENFWSLLKRALRGTYVNVEPFHLFRYLDEQAFRFNERKETDAGRFAKALRGIVGKGLRYAKLIGGEGIHCPETWQTT
jgi:transposase-like protein